MRLIDADVALQRFIKETETSGKNAIHINTIKRLLQDMDTAYDVEKVVAELEEEKQRLRRLKNDCIALSDSEVIAIEEKAYNFAIDIVKRGGIE